MGLCKKFEDGRVPVELLEAGVQIFSQYWQGLLVHFITGWPRVATYLLSAEAVANHEGSGTAASMLLNYVIARGMIHVQASDGYGIASTQETGRVLNSMSSRIAVAHPNVSTLPLTRQMIMAIPYQTGAAGRLNNDNYKNANTPIFYVGNTPCRSANAVYELLRPMDKTTVQSVCGALRARFFQQESNDPIESTEEETRMLRGQTIVCRINRQHRGARRRRARRAAAPTVSASPIRTRRARRERR